MIGLRTARVVVIDNNSKDGIAIVAALSRHGTGISFFTGNPDELPEKKLTGVRLLVLDMNLLETDAGEVRAILSPLINFLDKLIAENSKPFAIIAWTRHPAYIEEFQNMLNETRPDLKPYFMSNIEKNEVKKDGSPRDYDFSKILNRLETEAKLWFPFDLLMEWEQRVHDASSETTTALTEIANESSDTWQQEATKLLSVLTLESGGKRIGREEEIIACFFSSLNPIHEDFLESLPVDHARLSSQSQKLQEAIDEENRSRKEQRRSRLTSSQCSQLNRMLLLAYPKEEEHAPRPGNIYFKKGWKTEDYPINPGNINQSALGKEIINKPESDGKWRYIIYECVPAIVEITPLCDYSQDKTSHCRFILGLLVPEKFRKHIKPQNRTPFIREVGLIHMRESDSCPISGDYILVLNSRYVIGILSNKIVKNIEACRLRKQVLTDIQHWFAGQVARPGYVSIGDQ